MTAVSVGCRVAISVRHLTASSRSNGTAPSESPAWPTASIGSSPATSAPLAASASTPSQVIRTRAPLSPRWNATSGALSMTLSGTTTPPALRMPKYEMRNCGMLGNCSATESPGLIPIVFREAASRSEALSSSRYVSWPR